MPIFRIRSVHRVNLRHQPSPVKDREEKKKGIGDEIREFYAGIEPVDDDKDDAGVLLDIVEPGSIRLVILQVKTTDAALGAYLGSLDMSALFRGLEDENKTKLEFQRLYHITEDILRPIRVAVTERDYSERLVGDLEGTLGSDSPIVVARMPELVSSSTDSTKRGTMTTIPKEYLADTASSSGDYGAAEGGGGLGESGVAGGQQGGRPSKRPRREGEE